MRERILRHMPAGDSGRDHPQGGADLGVFLGVRVRPKGVTIFGIHTKRPLVVTGRLDGPNEPDEPETSAYRGGLIGHPAR